MGLKGPKRTIEFGRDVEISSWRGNLIKRNFFHPRVERGFLAISRGERDTPSPLLSLSRDKQNGSGWKEKRLIRAQRSLPRLFRRGGGAASCSLFRGKTRPFPSLPFLSPPSTNGPPRALINPRLPVHRSRGHAGKGIGVDNFNSREMKRRGGRGEKKKREKFLDT